MANLTAGNALIPEKYQPIFRPGWCLKMLRYARVSRKYATFPKSILLALKQIEMRLLTTSNKGMIDDQGQEF